jgi:hypothetical protein
MRLFVGKTAPSQSDTGADHDRIRYALLGQLVQTPEPPSFRDPSLSCLIFPALVTRCIPQPGNSVQGQERKHGVHPVPFSFRERDFSSIWKIRMTMDLTYGVVLSLPPRECHLESRLLNEPMRQV